MTYKEFIDDILMALGFTHDDAVRNRRAAAYNMGLIVDRLNTQRMRKDILGGMSTRTAPMQSTTYIVPVQSETYLNGRNYFKLPGDILNIPFNGGVEYIRYSNNSNCDKALMGKPFTIAAPGELHNLEADAFQRPSPAVPYYYRARLKTDDALYDDRIWLIGPGATVGSLEVGLYSSIGDVDAIDPEEEMNLPPDLAYLVKRQMLSMEAWVTLMPLQRRTNDGRDFKVGERVPVMPPLVSINDPINSTQEQ